jgi:hypothetical protein
MADADQSGTEVKQELETPTTLDMMTLKLNFIDKISILLKLMA